MMGLVIAGAVSLLAGAAAAMVYLTVFAQVPQMEAQWINLIFFLPIGGLALIFHAKNRLIEKKAVLPAVLAGLAGAAGGAALAHFLGNEALTRVFAVFLAVIGGKELFRIGK